MILLQGQQYLQQEEVVKSMSLRREQLVLEKEKLMFDQQK